MNTKYIRFMPYTYWIVWLHRSKRGVSHKRIELNPTIAWSIVYSPQMTYVYYIISMIYFADDTNGEYG